MAPMPVSGWPLPCAVKRFLDLGPRRSILFPRSFDDLLALSRLCRIGFFRQGNSEVKIIRTPLDPTDGVPDFEVLQVPRLKARQTVGEFSGVIVSDPKDDTSIRMRHDGAGEFGIAL